MTHCPSFLLKRVVRGVRGAWGALGADPESRAVRGFTMTELLVVVIIMGILVGIAVPKYEKTIETAKGDEGLALLQAVYAASKMQVISNCPTGLDCYCTGFVEVNSGAGDCNNGSNLVTLNLLPNLNVPAKSYCFRAANDDTASSYAACARRRSGASPGTGTAKFNQWGYIIDKNGLVSVFDAGGTGDSYPPPNTPTIATTCACP